MPHLFPGVVIFALTWAAMTGFVLHLSPATNLGSAMLAGFVVAIPLVLPVAVMTAFAFRMIRACYRFPRR
ncbi:hypothetical protein [Desulfobulbus elongatus]|uniref:hypothetical protein n=1 Tax=Desulfobulbus elongatus TaxID=53332 RepID=UPI00048051CC|nr:hypothetical protein [Desulfobulbus elongatus]